MRLLAKLITIIEAMHKRTNLISTFFFFLVLSGVLLAFSQTPLGRGTKGLAEVALSPVRVGVFTALATSKGEPSAFEKLQDENRQLRSELVKYKGQSREMQALRDQFALTATISTQQLLPTKIVGRRTIIPGFSFPDQLILDKGKSDGVSLGATVLYKDFFLGQISGVSDHLSIVDLSYRKGFSITATTADSGAIGVIKGQGQGEILLDNVVLSETLSTKSDVITRGGIDPSGKGVPPGLIIGKIMSVDKKPSALFQSAKVMLDVDITRLDTVFVLLHADRP